MPLKFSTSAGMLTTHGHPHGRPFVGHFIRLARLYRQKCLGLHLSNIFSTSFQLLSLSRLCFRCLYLWRQFIVWRLPSLSPSLSLLWFHLKPLAWGLLIPTEGLWPLSHSILAQRNQSLDTTYIYIFFFNSNSCIVVSVYITISP